MPHHPVGAYPAPGRLPTWRECAWLLLQMLLVCSVELADDLVRGNLARPDARLALAHAAAMARFERAHGFLLEGTLQSAVAARTGEVGQAAVWLTGALYTVGHLAGFFALLVWVHTCHRRHFARVRTLACLSGAAAVAGYELFPAAPPRLTHASGVHDSLGALIGGGALGGVGYNEYAAMPSLHVAWALIVSACLVVLARRPLVRVLGALYLPAMVFSVVITGSHWLLDAVGSAGAVALALVAVLVLRWMRRQASLFRRIPAHRRGTKGWEPAAGGRAGISSTGPTHTMCTTASGQPYPAPVDHGPSHDGRRGVGRFGHTRLRVTKAGRHMRLRYAEVHGP